MPAQKSLRRRPEKPPQHRCPGCRYFHAGPETLCTACEAQASTNGVLLTAPVPLPGGGATPPETPSAQETHTATPPPPTSVAMDVTPALDGSATRVPPDRRLRVCPCCVHSSRVELDVALTSPSETLHGIAARFECTVYALTQHRHLCLGIPPLTLHERGRRTQFLRKLNGDPAVISSPFPTHVVNELIRLEKELKRQAVCLVAVQEHQARLEKQAQCLRDYLRLFADTHGESERG